MELPISNDDIEYVVLPLPPPSQHKGHRRKIVHVSFRRPCPKKELFPVGSNADPISPQVHLKRKLIPRSPDLVLSPKSSPKPTEAVAAPATAEVNGPPKISQVGVLITLQTPIQRFMLGTNSDPNARM